MRKGQKTHSRVSSTTNQRLKAARKNAAALEAERAEKRGEAIEDDESSPLGGGQGVVDGSADGISLNERDVTETDYADDDYPVDDEEDTQGSGDAYSGEQDAPDEDEAYTVEEQEDELSSLPATADVADDDSDDVDVDVENFPEEDDEDQGYDDDFGEEEDEEDEEDEELSEFVGEDGVELTKRSPARRSAALPEGHPLVEWEVIDVLGADGDWLSRWHLQANPPTLVLRETETGQQIEMKLTRKVARDLDYSIHGIMSIYEEGIAYPEPRKNPVEWFKDSWWSYLEWVKAHKVLGFVTSALTLIMLLVLATSFVGTSLVSLLGGGLLGGKVDV